jgi:hypothetical protein
LLGPKLVQTETLDPLIEALYVLAGVVDEAG